jgi:hypothetical protein
MFISSVSETAYPYKNRNANLFNYSKCRHFVSSAVRFFVLDSEVSRVYLQFGSIEWTPSVLSTELWNLQLKRKLMYARTVLKKLLVAQKSAVIYGMRRLIITVTLRRAVS